MLTLDERRDLCSSRVTLNGHKATISGAQLDYAVIRVLDPDLPLSVEYTWDYANKMVTSHGGQFFTSVEARKAFEQGKKQAATTLKPKSKRQPPTLELTADQLDMLITAAAHEVDWYRNSTRADKAERIAGLDAAIKQFQALRNFKQGYH